MANPIPVGGNKASPQSIFESSDEVHHSLGTVATLAQPGPPRRFVYGLAGSSDLDPGKTTQSAAAVSNHTDVAVASAAAVGAKSVTVTLGATAATKNQYEGGLLSIIDAAGEGTQYLIKSHAAADSAASLELELYDEIAVALTTSSKASLVPHSHGGLVVGATAQTGTFTGVPYATITQAEYGWLQVSGQVMLLADEALTAGNVVTFGSSVAGSVEVIDLIGEPVIGQALESVTDTEYGRVLLFSAW